MAQEEGSAETQAQPSVPYSREAEEAVLGSVLQDGDAIAEVAEILKPEDFYVKTHALLFQALLDLFERGTPLDLTVIGDELLRRGEMDRIGGPVELVRLSEKVPSSANLVTHARIVLDRSLQRRLVTAAQQTLGEVRAGRQTIQYLVDAAEQRIFDVAHRSVGGSSSDLRTVLRETMQQIDARREGEISGVRTDYPELDEKLGGLQGGQMIILAARPSMGKTTLALNIALRAALDPESPTGVAIFSLEMSRQQLALNLLSCHSQVDSQLLRKGIGSSAESYERIGIACDELSRLPIFLDDMPGMTSLQIRAKARRLKAMHDIGLVVIDYVQLVPGPASESRQIEISQVSMQTKQLAKQLDVPVIAISQLNRSVDAREDHRPRMSDLRESGSLEQDADIVMFLYREDYYDQGRNPSTSNRAKLIIAKHRNGPIGEVDLSFFPERLRFEPYSDEDYRG